MSKQWIRVILAASKLGFTNLVMDEDWDRVKKLDQYVQTGDGNPGQHLNPED
ncbi:erythromycin esterase family protein [Paenibacillus glacialis]|uniref:erythromycin esterase family protein n=1 Tax=Paenibacillus glacialis TaxID=494026 RepID=UPI000A8DCC58|nr:erythromycin esterase family protein [Paenibacillus glacialis]